jgi:hypothetical protein
VRQDGAVDDDGYRVCRGCGARFERTPWALDQDLRAAPECWRAAGEVAAFAALHAEVTGPVAQLAVDSYGAQHAGAPTSVIRVAYALAGLHLALDRGLDGPAVRSIHQRMGCPQPWWPAFEPPQAPAGTTVRDVLEAGAGSGSPQGHVEAVRRWAGSVWRSWEPRQADVADLVDRTFPDGVARRPGR